MDRIHGVDGHNVGKILASCFAVLAFIAISEGANASPVTPLITPDGGYFKGGIQAGLQCPGLATNIYYTTDGSTPSPTHGTLYVPGTPVSITASRTLQAIAYDGTNSSAVASAAFIIGTTTTVALPTISPNGGNYTTGPVTVTLTSATSGAAIYYTTDGSVPTIYSTAYTAPFSVSTTATVRAIATKNGLVNSGIAGSTFTLGLASACAAPTLFPNGGSFTGWDLVSIKSTTPNAVIRYTTDGTTPTATSTQYIGGKYIGTTTTLEARAFSNGLADSPVTSATFTATTPAPAEIDVTAAPYNASTSSTDNTAAVQAALNAATNIGTGAPGAKWNRVYFPPGTYYFNNTVGLKPALANNLVIDGQGSTLIFANGVSPISTGNSNNVTVENMIIDSALPNASPGTVTESDPTGFDCLLDPGFLAANVATLPGLLQMDATQRTCARQGLSYGGGNTAWPASILGTGKVRITNKNSPFKQGDYLNLRTYASPQGLYFGACDGVNIDNVTIYGCPGMGVVAGGCSDISLVNVNVLVSPGSGRLNSSGADASMFDNDKGLISYQDCQFEGQGDDCCSDAGTYYTIQSVNYTTNQINIYFQYSESGAPNIKVGEMLEFRSGTTLAITGTAAVTAITQLGEIGGTPPNVEQLTLATAPPAGIADNSDVVHSLTWVSRLSVNRCNFIGNRARGVLIMAPNSTVQNSRFLNESGAGIEVCTVLKPWYVSTGVSNVQILNNSFENCNYGVGNAPGTIWVFASNQTGAFAPAGVHTGIVIADNTIRDIDNGGIVVSSVSNTDILNNTIENVAINPQTMQVPGYAPLPSYANDGLYALDASDVRMNNNVGVQSNYMRYLWNQWLPYWNPPASGAYNIQPFVIGFSQTSTGHAQWQLSWNVQSSLPTGEKILAHLCNSAGSDVKGMPAGNFGDPSTWVNGQRLVSGVLPVDLTSVADGTYTIRMGLYSTSTGVRLNLLGDSDGAGRIITGTLTISGGGGTITFTSQQLDVTATVSQFVQTGPRQFNIAYTWNVHDTIPTNETVFVNLWNSSGTVVQSFPAGTTPDPSTWAFGSQVTSSVVSVTLGNSIPDGTNYSVHVGLTNGTTNLPLSGQPDTAGGITTGTFTTETGTLAPLSWDAGTSTNITSSGNTGF